MSRLGASPTSRVGGNTRPRFSRPKRRVGVRSRPGRMARCRRSRIPAVATSTSVRVGCSEILNNRLHDPTIRTFLSVDPLVDKAGDPYLYAAGKPTTLSDPSVLDPGTSAPNWPWLCNRSVVALEGSGDAGGEQVGATRRRTGGSQHRCRG